jgi:small GTP-binding protein
MASQSINPDIQIHSFKLVILGEEAVGKSSIAQRFVNGKFTNLHQATIGALFLTKQIRHEDRIVKFEIWDTAGQERFHSLTPLYYKNAKAAIVVFDVANAGSFERAKTWVKDLMEKANPGIVIALCGNKIDLEDSRVVKKDDAEKYAFDIGSFYTEVSAKLDKNVNELFEKIVEKMPKDVQERNGIKLSDEEDNVTKNNYGYCSGYCGKSE